MSLLCLLLIGACTKSKSPTPSGTGSISSPYYFNFSIGSAIHYLNTNFPIYNVGMRTRGLGGNEIGDTNTLIPRINLNIFWKHKDTVYESDLMSLVGRTIYFDDTAIGINLEYDSSKINYSGWFSDDTSDHNYYVKVKSIAFLKNDTAFLNPIRVYVINGTCSAVIQQDTSRIATLTNGQFNFLFAGQITK